MPGSKLGGLKAAQTNREKYGNDFYARIGRIGGSKFTGAKGFALNRELARIAGRKGGLKSRRGKKVK
jgi:general stress protein YciG